MNTHPADIAVMSVLFVLICAAILATAVAFTTRVDRRRHVAVTRARAQSSLSTSSWDAGRGIDDAAAAATRPRVDTHGTTTAAPAMAPISTHVPHLGD